MPALPLTHHQILELVEPFTRRGRQVDLAATDRAARKLAFKPIEIASADANTPALRETLHLDCWGDERFELTRTLAHPSGLQATLAASGSEPGALLAQIEAVPPHSQFEAGPGYVIALSHEVEATSRQPGTGAKTRAETAAGSQADPPPPLQFRQGEVQLDGLRFRLNVRSVRGIAGDITLTPNTSEPLALPDDLLAVQGWDWARLIRRNDGWTSKLRLRGSPQRRSRAALVRLRQVAAHLAGVLAQTPSEFHDTHLWARWGMVLRRGIPTLTVLMLVGGALLLPRFTDVRHTGLLVALQYVSIAALAVSFTLQELPQFEIPPWPRRSRAPSWRQAARDDASGLKDVRSP
jgi:hypothetical protein